MPAGTLRVDLQGKSHCPFVHLPTVATWTQSPFSAFCRLILSPILMTPVIEGDLSLRHGVDRTPRCPIVSVPDPWDSWDFISSVVTDVRRRTL